MDYSSEIPIRADGPTVFETLRSTFMKEGYMVSPVSGNRIEVSPTPVRAVDLGRFLRSMVVPVRRPQSQYAALQGVSRAEFMISGKTLWVEAELKGRRTVRNFLLVLLIGFGILYPAIISFSGLFAEEPWYKVFVDTISGVVVGSVLVLLIFYLYHKFTKQALDTLMEHLQTLGDQ